MFYGLLAYTFVFYTQIGSRVPILGQIRLEFILGSAMLLAVGFKILNGEVRVPGNTLNWLAITLLFVMLATIPFAYVKMRALRTFITVFKIFCIYLMIVPTINTEDRLRKFMILYLAVNAWIFLEPFFLSLQGKGFIYNNHMWRLAGITGMFSHPNGLGMLTATNLPFFYHFMRSSESKLAKAISFAMIPIGLRVIMLTQSRTAFLGVLTFAALLWLRSKRKALALLAGLIVGSLLWAAAPDQTKNRFLTLGESVKLMTENLTEEERASLGSMASRWELMRRSLVAFRENPVLGLGLDCFASYNGRRWGLWFPPHNTYLQVLSETGLLGAVCLFLLVSYTFKNFRRARLSLSQTGKESSFMARTLPGVVDSYVIWLVVSFFGIELYNNFWWIFGGLSVVILSLSYQTDHP